MKRTPQLVCFDALPTRCSVQEDTFNQFLQDAFGQDFYQLWQAHTQSVERGYNAFLMQTMNARPRQTAERKQIH